MRYAFSASVLVFTTLLITDLSPTRAESSAPIKRETKPAEAPQKSPLGKALELESSTEDGSSRARFGLTEELEMDGELSLEEEILRAQVGAEETHPKESSRHGRAHLSRKRLKPGR